MRRKLTLPVLVLLSAAGVALQYWNQAAGYDALNLPIPGAPSLLAASLFALVCLVVALVLASDVLGRKAQPGDLYARLGRPGMALGMAAGVITAIGGLGKVVQALPAARQLGGILILLVYVLLVGAGVAMVWLALTPNRPEQSGPALAPLVPGFAGCFWLAVFYHTNSQDPVVSHYGWVLLGLMAFILASYYQAGWSFDRRRPFRAMALSALAVLLLFFALPTAAHWADLAVLGGFGLWMVTAVTQIPKTTQTKGSREA